MAHCVVIPLVHLVFSCGVPQVHSPVVLSLHPRLLDGTPHQLHRRVCIVPCFVQQKGVGGSFRCAYSSFLLQILGLMWHEQLALDMLMDGQLRQFSPSWPADCRQRLPGKSQVS